MNSFYFIFSKTNLQNRFVKQILKTKIEKRSKQTLNLYLVYLHTYLSFICNSQIEYIMCKCYRDTV